MKRCATRIQQRGAGPVFCAAVGIDNPRPPTHGSSYVENWDEFAAFVDKAAHGAAS